MQSKQMEKFTHEISLIINEVITLASMENKLTGFCIGNTRKINSSGPFFSPIRKSNRIISGSVMVYSLEQALEVAHAIDGKVDYVLVDTEKKISPELYASDNVGNVERAVRETIKVSKVLTYKGNDMTVDSIENLIVQILTVDSRGISGKKGAIIGVGNIGSKLALKLVERGMNVSVFRRDREKLEAIVQALNLIKPKETIATITAGIDGVETALDADLLIGLTPGIPVITKTMVDGMAENSILMDGGKGCCEQGAISRAQERNIGIYRADIRPGFEGHIGMVLATEAIIENGFGRSFIDDVAVVSGGLLAYKNEVVVDNVVRPSAVYGLANGFGDFIREPNEYQLQLLKTVKRKLK
jgi:hypothetical protein